MTGCQSMKSKLAPLGLYLLSEGSVVDCELKAYAAGIDPLLQELELLEREGFITTAESFGLSEREAFVDREKPGLSAQARRALLLEYEQNLGISITPDEFTRQLESFGLQAFRFTEHPLQRVLDIHIDEELTAGRKNLISKKIRSIVPIHIYVSIIYADSTSESL